MALDRYNNWKNDMMGKAELEAFAMSRGARDCSVMISMAVVEKIEKELPASCFGVPYISKLVCCFVLFCWLLAVCFLDSTASSGSFLGLV